MENGKWKLVFGLRFFLAAWLLTGSAALTGQVVSKSDRSVHTYTNPIIHADYSDPDVIRVATDFYLTASSFNSAPGLPVLHSRDLVSWRIIGHALQQQVPLQVFSTPQHGNGVWAPAMRWRHGTFYIFYGDPDFGIYVVKATNPVGPWSKPLLIRQAKGWIDPCPFWDDDGNAYLVHAWANSRAGIKSILTINRMSPDGTRILDEGRTIFDGHAHHPTIEGPKLYKRNGFYYIFSPAGGVSNGWQTVLRARNIYGPYEDRIVMDQGQTNVNGPHQGSWVETKSAESWFIHFQDKGAYGRIVHLQPVRWVNDWPVIGIDRDGDGKGEPVVSYKKPDAGGNVARQVLQTTDEFASTRLGLQWQWQANYEDEWQSLRQRRGWLRLHAVAVSEGSKNLWSVPSLLLQKFPAEEFTVTTKVDVSSLRLGQRCGLVIMGLDYSSLTIVRKADGLHLMRTVCHDADKGTSEREEAAAAPATRDQLFLQVAVTKGANCDFQYSFDGKGFVRIGDGFTARPGKWIGARVGLFCLAEAGLRASSQPDGYADFDWFRVSMLTHP